MDRPLKEFVSLVSKSIKIDEPIYEFGSRQMKGQETFADLRLFFKGQTYIGTDYIEGPGVDVVLDLHNLDLSAKSVGTVICMEVFEHVREPWVAINEISRVIKDNGLLILSAPMNSRIHGSPYDYWRFTPQGFEVLFKNAGFKYSFIGFDGSEAFPKNIVAIASKNPIQLNSFEKDYIKWNYKWGGRRDYIVRAFKKPFTPFIPTIFTGSAFELWRRQLNTPQRNHFIHLIIILLPPIIRSVLRRVGVKFY